MAKQNLPAPQVIPFDGDPETLQFFKTQVMDVAKMNKWQDEHIVFFLKQNLKGPALKYIIQCSQNTNFDTPQQIFESLENFFKNKSLPQALSEFSSFRLLPGENINNLAHRLNCITAKAYPKIVQKDVLNEIKLNKLLEIVPTDIRTHLLKSSVSNYDEAIKQAQLVQDCAISNEVLNQIHDKRSDLDLIKEEINYIKTTLDKKQEEKEKEHTSSSYDRNQDKSQNRKNFQFPKNRNHWYKSRIPFRQFKRFEKSNSPSNKACHFCGSFQHLIRQCKKFKEHRNKQNTNQRPVQENSSQPFPNFIAPPSHPPMVNWPQIPGFPVFPYNFAFPPTSFMQNSSSLNPNAPKFVHNTTLAIEPENQK